MARYRTRIRPPRQSIHTPAASRPIVTSRPTTLSMSVPLIVGCGSSHGSDSVMYAGTFVAIRLTSSTMNERLAPA